MLAANRLMSHSNGPGMVSSKSLTSKIRSRLGRGVEPEVGQVGVAAQLHHQSGLVLGGQIGGHHRGRPPEEGEGRCRHPAVADGDEFRDAAGPLQGQDLQGVGPVRRGGPLAVPRSGDLGPGLPPEFRPFCRSRLSHGSILPLPGAFRPRGGSEPLVTGADGGGNGVAPGPTGGTPIGSSKHPLPPMLPERCRSESEWRCRGCLVTQTANVARPASLPATPGQTVRRVRRAGGI